MICSNTSILRTSMRDKRRMTQVAVEREKQLAEQVEAKLAKEEAEENGSIEGTTRPLPNAQPTTITPATAAVSSPRQVPKAALDHRSPPKANGYASPPARAGTTTSTTSVGPAVPPRTPRVRHPSFVSVVGPIIHV